jgi:hypothetical protein
MSAPAAVAPVLGRPWYTQFWPWFLIGLPAVSVVVSVTALVLAIGHADSLVSDDWYKRGLAVNRDLGRAEAAARLGLGATMRVDGPRAELVVTLNAADAARDADGAELEIEMRHPTSATRDRTYRLARSGPSRYRAALDGELVGRWYVSLGPPSGAWRLAAPLTLAPGVTARLVPER